MQASLAARQSEAIAKPSSLNMVNDPIDGAPVRKEDVKKGAGTLRRPGVQLGKIVR
jgi:hypothetical protein